ncbi:hypothetical protein V6N13_087049 [Hibiscus sabdariffa]
MGNGEKSFRSFDLHQHQARAVPKGCIAIKVGSEGEEQQRFVVPRARCILEPPILHAAAESCRGRLWVRPEGYDHHPLSCPAVQGLFLDEASGAAGSCVL